MNILILGGAGFLGNNLARRCLQDSSNKITIVDSLDPKFQSNILYLNDIKKSIQFIKGDMRSKSLMRDVVKNKDVIFNCAAQTSHPLSMSDPFLDVKINCLGNLTLLEAMRRYNKKAKVVYVSTSSVIGRAQSKIVDERHKEQPLDIYSADKAVAEKYYYIYHNTYGLNTLTLRFSNLYGSYGKNSPEFGFINYFIYLAKNNKKITIYGRGKQKRNVMFVEDAADLLYECIKHDALFKGNCFFAVSKEHYSVIDIAREIVSVFGKGKVATVRWPQIRKEIEIKTVHISGASLNRKVKWKPKYTFHKGLLKTQQITEEKGLLI